MGDHDTIAGMLQALEHVSDQVDLLSQALERFITAQERGEAVPPAVVAHYREQLGTVRGQMARSGSTSRSGGCSSARRRRSERLDPGPAATAREATAAGSR